jgi:short-subunit dehydrogenase
MPATILITGASQGIGAALAARYARDGGRLALVARNRERLAAVEADCRRLGAAEVRIAAIDVRDRETLGTWIESLDRAYPVDTVIANAGVLSGIAPGAASEDAEASHRLCETNILGVMNTLHPLIPAMVARRAGQIAIVSSLAAFIPLPHMPSYSASKACMLSYGQSLRALLRAHGVRVSVACPGYVDTAMTEQVRGAKPFLLSADDAAARIVAGLERDRAVIAFPFLLSCLTRLGGILPGPVRRLSSRFSGKIFISDPA